jgi:hypothetical protein
VAHERWQPTLVEALVIPVVLIAGTALWLLHAGAWSLGNRSPILGYETAQYALAARELAWHGRLATPFALPVELERHASPPWPLSSVQPGVVLAEALVYRLVPAQGDFAGSDPRAALSLVLPFMCFLLAGAALSLSARHVIAHRWPGARPVARAAAALVVGLAFVLDPEAQHFAIGSFSELPFTVGLLLAVFGLALEVPARTPLRFGLGLGLAALFRADMLWLAPVFALAGAWSGPRERAGRTFALVMLGWLAPIAPWWFYKWRAFGSPLAELSHLAWWDGIRGQTWFALTHQASLPPLPRGAGALALLAGKIAHNLPALLGAMTLGPRPLWLGALAGWLVLARPGRPFVAAAGLALVALAAETLSAAASLPWSRTLFPARVLIEPLGMLSLWALVARMRSPAVTAAMRRTLYVLVAAIALGWGGWCTARGVTEARAASRERSVPASHTLTSLSIVLNERIPPGEVIMSNLGPALAWQTNHPVVHLALAPADVEACRRRLDIRHVVLVYRDARDAWGQWSEIVARDGWANTLGMGVAHETRYTTKDGFLIVWLELKPRGPALASATR